MTEPRLSDVPTGQTAVRVELTKNYRKLYSQIFAVCLKIVCRLPNAQDIAADLTHETFARALANEHKFKGTAQVSVWMFRIAYNISMDYLRHLRQRPTVFIEDLKDSSDDGVVATLELPADAIPDILELRDLTRLALKGLSHRNAKVILLTYVQGHGGKEAAEMLDMNHSTLKTAQHRGLQQSRGNLSRVGVDTFPARSV